MNEDDIIEVELDKDADAKEEVVIQYDEDATNLVPVFAETKEGKEYLKRISEKVSNDFQADWDSTSEYRDRRKADWKIFAGDLPPKDFPFKDAANPHVPLMLENLSRLCFRATGELFGDWQTILSAVPMGADDENVAQFVTRHMNWQFNEQIPDFKRQIGHRGVLTFFAHGDVVVHSYHDPETRLNRHEVLTCDNFVTPFVHVTTMPDFSDCPHYTKVLRFYRHQLEARRDSWYDVDKVLKKTHPSWDDEPEAPLAEAVGETQGISPENSDSDKKLGGESAPYTLLWYEGWLHLPNQDKDRWCQVILDKHSKCILNLMIHERANWQDRERFNGQMMEKEMFAQAMSQHQMTVQAHEAATMQHQAVLGEVDGRISGLASELGDALKSGMMDGQNATAMLDVQSRQVDGMLPPPPPPPPEAPLPPDWMLEKLVPGEDGAMPDPMSVEPDPIRREPVYLFTHGVCIEPLHGNLGLSYGIIQADLNRAANTALAQFTDAATLNNCASYITSGLEFEGGDLDLSPGAVNKAKGSIGQELKNHIMPIQPGPASPQLMDVVKLSIDTAQSSIQSPNVLSGEAGKSGETARGLMGRIEQATKQLSVVTGKYADVVVQVGKNNAYLNSVFLPEEEIVKLLNTESQRYEELKVGKGLYEKGYKFQLRADLRFATQVQKIEEADSVLQMCLQVPPLAANASIVYTAIKQAFIARGRYDLVQKMGSPPPDQQQFPVPGPPPGAQQPGAPAPNGAPPAQGGPQPNAPAPQGPPS
jgi:hypothetical protein